ncbi:MAG: hypothetical protein SF028_10950 [Candidatus Sumerlaeia bacterium]|nr:hypothetical protein [Candidatus Sumerlaeia bacterium]
MGPSLFLTSLLTLAFAILLAWGVCRRTPAGSRRADPPAEDAWFTLTVAGGADVPPPPARLLCYRMTIDDLWREDAPDLEITAWRNPDALNGLEYRAHQEFIALPEDRESVLAALERRVIAQVHAAHGGPRQFLKAWHFLHSPVLGASLVATTEPSGRAFRHELFALEGDGAFRRIELKDAGRFAELLGPAHLAYRNALAAWCGGAAPEAAARQFRNARSADRRQGGAHAWQAILALRAGAAPESVRGLLAMAAEQAPGLPSTRFAECEARFGDLDAERHPHVGELGADAFAGDAALLCLLAQAFLVFDQYWPAGILCERALALEPRDPAAGRLLERIAERRRGRDH